MSSMSAPRPPASMILVNYNTRDLLLAALERFAAPLLAADWQIIVVDNGSQDGSAQAVADRFPAVMLLASSKNQGFAAGNNLGLRQAQGDVFILLNTDVIVTPEQLQALAAYLLSQPDIGAVSPGLRTVNGKPQAFAYGSRPSPFYLVTRGLRRLLRLGPMHDWGVATPIEPDWVSGACLAVRRAVYEQVGGLDERYFLYFEDVDWCTRIRRAGWRVVYNPVLQIIHLGGQSERTRTAANEFYTTSLRLYYAEYYPWWPSWLLDRMLKLYRAQA